MLYTIRRLLAKKLPSITPIKTSRYDPKEYIFSSKSEGNWRGTQLSFRDKFGISAPYSSKLASGAIAVHKGWSVK